MQKYFLSILKIFLLVLICFNLFNTSLPVAEAARPAIWYDITDNLLIFEEEDVYHMQGRQSPLQSTIVRLVGVVLSLLGLIFLILIIYGGLVWMTAGGNEEQIKKARDILKHGIIGLGIVLGAYAISWFVIRSLIIGFG